MAAAKKAMKTKAMKTKAMKSLKPRIAKKAME